MAFHRRSASNKDKVRPVESRLRVIGGAFRGRTIHYTGDPGLRPMKDRVREAVFNLIGPRVKGTQVVDLFAGTGALTFEALSRGAAYGSLVERSFPNAEQIKQTAVELGIADRLTVQSGDTFLWSKRLQLPMDSRWLVFCSPPYDFFLDRQEDLRQLVTHFWNAAPAGSLIVVESDQRFDPTELLPAVEWDVRPYAPAVIGIAVKPA